MLVALGLTACNNSGNSPQQNHKHKEQPHWIEVSTVEIQTLQPERERTGNLQIRRWVRIHSQEKGRITQIPYYEGDSVHQGSLVASLDDSLLEPALHKAEAQLRLAQRERDRAEQLVQKQVASEDSLTRAIDNLAIAQAEVQMLQTRLNHARIHAPFDAIVSERRVEPEDIATENQHLLTLIDPTSLNAEVSLSELLLPHLKIGDPVEIRIDALGTKRFPGHILRIHPQVDPANRQARVEVAFDPVPEQARAGQLARILFRLPPQQALTVPFSCLRRDPQGTYLYRLVNGEATQARVETGLRSGNLVQITQGLNPGDRIIVKGFLGLRPGKKVSISKSEHARNTK